MEAKLRAAADRVLFDTAVVLYIASGVQQGQESARAEPDGWDVRRVLGHLGASLLLYSEAVERAVRGEELLPPGWDPDRTNSEGATRDAELTVADAEARLRAGRRALLAVLDSNPAHIQGSTFRDLPVVDIVDTWSRHCAAHAFDLVDALPQFRTDPIALTWALFLDASGSPRLAERRMALVRDVEAHLGQRKES